MLHIYRFFGLFKIILRIPFASLTKVNFAGCLAAQKYRVPFEYLAWKIRFFHYLTLVLCNYNTHPLWNWIFNYFEHFYCKYLFKSIEKYVEKILRNSFIFIKIAVICFYYLREKMKTKDRSEVGFRAMEFGDVYISNLRPLQLFC